MPPRESSQRIRVTLYRSNGGLKYKGEMRQNLFDGWGEARYSNGNVYTGYWQLGKRHGYGDLKSVDSNGDVIRIYSGNLLPMIFIKKIHINIYIFRRVEKWKAMWFRNS